MQKKIKDKRYKSLLMLNICIDTEGPLTESLKSTFIRIKNQFGINLKPTKTNLKLLQTKKKKINYNRKIVADFVAAKRLAYLNNWKKVSNMIKKITSKKFRYKFKDSFGNPLKFSWYIIDTIGYKNNPRKKAFGYHAILDKTKKNIKNFNKDSLGWHFHTVPANRNAIEYNTSWTSNDYHEQSLCRRLIERKTFSPIFRAGGHIERNDINYWLENFIPFDFSCRSIDPIYKKSRPGDINDWRHSPYDWSHYNPNFYDYRKKGSMKRTLFRALDIDTNSCEIDEYEITKAFKRATKEKTILSVSTHDRRDIEPEINKLMKILNKVSKKFKNVKWLNCNSLEAARELLKLKKNKVKIQITIRKNTLYIRTNTKLFGTIPFIAVKEKNNIFYRDNPTIESSKEWCYKIKKDIKSIGIAAVDNSGNVDIKVLKL
jgi:hypothetical protein